MALQLVGASSCPFCTALHLPLQSGFGHNVIYRRSHRSITYRCKVCGSAVDNDARESPQSAVPLHCFQQKESSPLVWLGRTEYSLRGEG